MNKYLLILFLITTHLVASSQIDFIKVKAKAKQVNNIVKVKAKITGSFVNPMIAKRHHSTKKNDYFITHVTANVNGIIVYDISLSHTFSMGRYGSFFQEFNFLYEGRGDTLNFVVTDNRGKQFKHSIKIKNSLGKNDILSSRVEIFKPIDYRKNNPKLWELTNTNEAIKELYGMSKGIPNIINIIPSELNRNSIAYHIALSINSKIKMHSIAIFSDDVTSSPEKEKYPSIRAIISLPKNTTVDNLPFSILTIGTCCINTYVPITVVGVDEEGKVYKTTVDATLLCSADCEM